MHEYMYDLFVHSWLIKTIFKFISIQNIPLEAIFLDYLTVWFDCSALIQ